MQDKSIKIPVNKIKKELISDDSKDLMNKLSEAGFEVTPVKSSSNITEIESLQKGLMKVSFPKFVKLVSNWDYEELLKVYADKDLIIDSDLLIDLASFKPSRSEEDFVEVESEGMSGIITGLLIGILVSLVLFLIFIR